MEAGTDQGDLQNKNPDTNDELPALSHNTDFCTSCSALENMNDSVGGWIVKWCLVGSQKATERQNTCSRTDRWHLNAMQGDGSSTCGLPLPQKSMGQRAIHRTLEEDLRQTQRNRDEESDESGEPIELTVVHLGVAACHGERHGEKGLGIRHEEDRMDCITNLRIADAIHFTRHFSHAVHTS